MTREQLKESIIAGLRIIAPESDPAGLGPDDNIREALDIDSYSFLRLLVGLAERTGVEIPEADYGKVATMTALIDYLAARRH